MADPKKKKLGLFFENDALFFVLNDQSTRKRIISVPLTSEVMQKALDNPLAPEGTKVSFTIQESLRKNKMSHNTVYLSLPSRDVIFRSFIIPWMQSKEIKSVVEFEATKYIPFALKELAYSYHAMNITEEGSRRLRVIFVAVKKETLSRYTKLLEEAALHVKLVEPAPLSLIRALIKKQKLPETETVALIDKREKRARIIIVQENTPMFVREFQLSISGNQAVDETVDTAELLRLTNEVRISLDYFNRQEKGIKVSKILFIGSEETESYAQMLEEDLELPTEALLTQFILDSENIKSTGFVNAYGVSLKDEVELAVSFDLSKEAPQGKKITRQTFKKNLNLKEILPTATVCLLIAFISVGISKFYIVKRQTELATIEQKLGPSKSASISKLQVANDNITKKLNAYKRVRLKSNVSFFLSSIPALMPEGTWIDTLTFSEEEVKTPAAGANPDKAPEVKTFMELSGYAYAPFKRMQFQLINDFLLTIKESEEYKSYFKDIKLEDVRSQQMGEYEVTSFRIRFQ